MEKDTQDKGETTTTNQKFEKFFERLFGIDLSNPPPSTNIPTPKKLTSVILNIYDLPDLTKVNKCTMFLGLGAFHSGVEVYGEEYSYGFPEGIYNVEPKTAPYVRYHSSIYLGEAPYSEEEVLDIIEQLEIEFTGESYHAITKNCNHFTDAFCLRLVKRGIPDYINRLAKIAKPISLIVPQDKLVKIGASLSSNSSSVPSYISQEQK